VVLPTPGTSSMRMWPRARRATIASSTTFALPSRAPSTARRSSASSSMRSASTATAEEVIVAMLARERVGSSPTFCQGDRAIFAGSPIARQPCSAWDIER
jgi:hypothetical protein